MLHFGQRLSEWKDVVLLTGQDLNWFWRIGAVIHAGRKMVLALLSGPVPADVWRNRMRTCLRCPVFDRELYACRKRLTDGRVIGCGCYTPYQALTAVPYPKGCWAANVTDHQEGWPEYRFPDWRARLTAILRFLFT